MNSKKFKYARELIKYLETNGGNEKKFFTFNFPDKSSLSMILEESAEGTQINCTCKHCSIHGGVNQYLCVYKIALILKLAGVR